MRFSQVEFSIQEAWKGFCRGRLMTVITIFSCCVALVICGMFILLLVNIHHLTERMGSQLEVSVYLKKDIPQEKIPILKAEFARISGVKEVQFISKKVAWEKFQKEYKNINLNNLVDDNPLPNTFKIKVEYLHQTKGVAKRLAMNPAVEEVQSSGELAERLQRFSQFINIGVLILISVIVVATLFLIVNAIHVTVIARENEINIMQLVGASPGIIQGPFVIEGIMMNFVGGSIAWLILKVSYTYFLLKIQQEVPFFPLTVQSYEVNVLFGILFLFGLFLGGLGGYISVGRSLYKER